MRGTNGNLLQRGFIPQIKLKEKFIEMRNSAESIMLAFWIPILKKDHGSLLRTIHSWKTWLRKTDLRSGANLAKSFMAEPKMPLRTDLVS